MENFTVEKVNRVIKALESNNIEGFYVESACKVKELVKSLINKGDTISFGGSVTLSQCGIFELLKSEDYTLLDRDNSKNTPQDIQKIYRDSFSADVYISSTNAVTEGGDLYNVDGNGNRVAAITFGPKKVIIIAGYNKIVKNLDAAIKRVKDTAAPLNCKRLSRDTYCSKCGHCVSLAKENSTMTDGCSSPDRICRHYIVTSRQRDKDRIKVILVGEELGY